MEDGSADIKRKLLSVLDEAIEQERLAQERYALGASLTTYPAVKEMFLQLVEDEMGHERVLRERQQSLMEDSQA
jgi:rubrerythrin